MKKTVLIGVCACGLLFFLAALASNLPLSRTAHPAAAGQKPWNSHAVGGIFAGVQVREVDATHAAVVFLYDLDNRTGADFQLTPGPGSVVMKRLKPDGSLSSDQEAHLVSAAFVPANNRTRIAVEVTDPFDWPRPQDASADQTFRGFVARETSGMDGFVIFDRSSRYEIELPIKLASIPPAEGAVPARKTG